MLDLHGKIKVMTPEELMKPQYKEEWKPIIGFEHYEISNHGRVRKISYLRSHVTKSVGYPQVQLFKGDGCGKKRLGNTKKPPVKKMLIHRMVAEAFVANPNSDRIVNHKDGNKLNYLPENLEWCTYSHNMKHAYKLGLNKGSKGRGKFQKATIQTTKEEYEEFCNKKIITT